MASEKEQEQAAKFRADAVAAIRAAAEQDGVQSQSFADAVDRVLSSVRLRVGEQETEKHPHKR